MQLKDRERDLKAKERSKKGERDRFRNSMNDELQNQGDTLRKFEAEVSSMKQIQMDIDKYISSNKEEDFERITAKINSLRSKLEAKRVELGKIEPALDEITKELGDQETHKKLIEDNLKLLTFKDTITKLKEEVEQVRAEMEKVEGYDTYADAISKNEKRKEALQNQKSHEEGRKGAFVEQIRLLRVSNFTEEWVECTALLLLLTNVSCR